MTNYEITLNDTGTLIEKQKIECENAVITVKDNSSLTLSDFNCSGICKIDINDSSSLFITSGNINHIIGDISDSSKSVCNAMFDNKDLNISDSSIFSTT